MPWMGLKHKSFSVTFRPVAGMPGIKIMPGSPIDLFHQETRAFATPANRRLTLELHGSPLDPFLHRQDRLQKGAAAEHVGVGLVGKEEELLCAEGGIVDG